MKVSITIMGCPERLSHIRWMKERLPADTQLSLDLKHKGVWPNARKSWLLFDKSCSHHLVIQDDVLLCKDFYETICYLTELLPDNILGLYHNQSVDDEAGRNNNIHWLQTNVVSTAQGLIFPSRLIPDFIHFADTHVEPSYKHDDSRIGLWQKYGNGPKSFFTIPTLLEHLEPSGSLLHNNNRKRVSGWWVGETNSGLAVDWKAGLTNPIKQHISLMKNTERAMHHG